MRRNLLQGGRRMSAAVQQARNWANSLVLRESRGPGDLPNAMDRLERKYGVPRGLLWSLRYRPPKDLLIGAYLQIRNAYLADCEMQKRRLEHEIEITKATAGHTAAVGEAETLVAEMEGKMKGATNA